jgi:hypothetical protein
MGDGVVDIIHHLASSVNNNPQGQDTSMDAPGSRALEALPSLAVLQSWVHHRQALAPCFVSDVYSLRALREELAHVSRTTRGELDGLRQLTTDVFLLDHFPCKCVELVGWVAGVDHKDASMTITCAFVS